MQKNLLVLPGDGIGQEVMAATLPVVEKAAALSGIEINFSEGLVGGVAIDATGDPLPEASLAAAKAADAVLFGGVGGPKWDNLPMSQRPERGLLRLRKELELFANLRPALLFAPLADASSLKRELVEDLDILILRELTGGIYFGEPRGIRKNGAGNEREGFNTLHLQ